MSTHTKSEMQANILERLKKQMATRLHHHYSVCAATSSRAAPRFLCIILHHNLLRRAIRTAETKKKEVCVLEQVVDWG